MIVDDERIVREGIRFILEKSFQDYCEVVAMAKTGREAIALFEKVYPEIVLMDIQMPGINGLETIKRLIDKGHKTHYVVISAYEQFDYAKQAVSLGVSDYLLKPIERQQFEQVLHGVIRKIRQDADIREKELETQEKLDRIVPILEYGYIYSLIMSKEYGMETMSYHRLLDIQGNYGYIMVIEFGHGDSQDTLVNRIGSGVKGTMTYDTIRESLKYKGDCVIGPLMINRIVAVFFHDDCEDEYGKRIQAINNGKRLVRQLKSVTGLEVYIGISRMVTIDQLNGAYIEAIDALYHCEDESVMHSADLNVSKTINELNHQALMDRRNGLIQCIHHPSDKPLNVEVEAYIRYINAVYHGDIIAIRHDLMELMVMLNLENHYETNSLYLEEMKCLTTVFELKAYTLRLMEEIMRYGELFKEEQVSSIIRQAIDYMEHNYNKDMRLKDVAEHVAVSPQYFSKLFKDECHINFIDYLTHIRVREAKVLLKEQRHTVKEISFSVGYNDPNYFSRIFKKLEGVTPTDFLAHGQAGKIGGES